MLEGSEHYGKTIRLCVSYGLFIAAYFTLILSNKAISTKLGNEDWIIVACVIWQGVSSVFLLLMASILGISPSIKALSRRKVNKIAFAPILFSLMILSSMESLKYISIPAMISFRNCTVVTTALGEWIIFGSTITFELVVVIALMFFSALLGCWREISTSYIGMFWVIVNILSSAGYLLYLRIIMQKTRMTNLGLAYYNNLLCIPILIPILVYLRVSSPENLNLFYIPYSTSFCSLLLVNGIAAFGMTIGSFWALRTSSATTFSITRSLSKIPLSVVGLWLFPAQFTMLSQASIIMALFTGVLFAYYKHVQHKSAIVLPQPNKSFEL